MRRLSATPASPGAAVGRAVRVTPSRIEERARTPHVSAADRDAEVERLGRALERASAELAELARVTEDLAGADVAAIFEAQALFARDPGIVDPALDAIRTDLLPADVAFGVSAERQAEVLLALDDDYFRQRASDVRDVARRVCDILAGRAAMPVVAPDGSRPIVVAVDLDASQVAQLRPETIAGVALAGGAANGHAAIVARGIGIPMVVGGGPELMEVNDGALLAIDGGDGRLAVEPEPEEVSRFMTPSTPPTTSVARRRGRVTVAMLANVGSELDMERAMAVGVQGVGLVRTELLFIGRRQMPSVEEQRSVYARLLEAAGERPVTFRTFDFGADKPWAGITTGATEANPALGVRGIRLALRHPDALRDQLTAMLRAAADRELRVMFPMISTIEEVASARAILEEVRSTLLGVERPTEVRVGVMVEVPSAIFAAGAIAERVDFLSIGTNDLVQYLMAADRTNGEFADLASPLQPAVLRALAMAVRAARAAGTPVGVCGEAAADPMGATLLVGLGASSLSMDAAAIERVRSHLASVGVRRAQAAARRALAATTLDEVHAALREPAGGS